MSEEFRKVFCDVVASLIVYPEESKFVLNGIHTKIFIIGR